MEKRIKKERESGIELLKIIGLFLIIIAHVIETYSKSNGGILNHATSNIQDMVLMFLRYLGLIGNVIFIVSSCWFLIGRSKDNKKKIFKLIVEVFVISIIMLCIFLILGTKVKTSELVQSFFPTTFATNWYVTCYIFFLMAIPFLNIIIEKVNKKQLLRICIFLLLMYWIIGFVYDLLFVNKLIIFIAMFFITAYIKKYLNDFTNNKKKNTILLIIGLFLLCLFIILVNVVGLRVEIIGKDVFRWHTNNNPIILLIGIALFNLFKNHKFTNKTINNISALTLYMYIIHDNVIVRRYLRVDVWKWIGDKFTYNNIIIETIIYAILLFSISLFLSILYKFTIKKIVDYVVERLYNSKIKEKYKKFENKLLEIK